MAEVIRIGGVPEHFNLPWRLAADAGAFAGTGVEVAWREYSAGSGELTRALRDNELDLAVVLTEGAVADILNHDRNRIAKVWVASPLVWGIHVAAQSNFDDVRDTRGRRIAISRYGSGSHLIPIVDAAERGWPTDGMEFVVVNGLDGAREALARGRADVFFWERHMTQPLVDAGEFRRVGEREVPWPAFVVSGRRDVLERRNREVRAVLDVAARAAVNVKRRKSTAPLVAETFGLRGEDVDRWLAHVRWARGYRCPAAALERAAGALQAQGVVPAGRIDAARLWFRL
ncbi:MAG TPA: PhnD/SsuA/transferrin family substrate-binding protein [Woeseiaceae bacterium]|nr:PhnD/SsuA/transferrin family substrate-binding protein [Woeseiaceae bacterium]